MINKEVLTQILQKNKIYLFSLLAFIEESLRVKSYHIVVAALQVTGSFIRQKLCTILTLRHSDKPDICLMHGNRKLKSYFFIG